MTLPCFPASRVLERIRHGSSSPLVVETEGGFFVAKLRGAGHGVLALISELVVGHLAETLGLPIPERTFIDLPENVTTEDHNDALADLLQRSTGLNLGFRFLDGAREPRPEELQRFDDEFVARVLWLDGLTMNPDRTDRNPNILVWKTQPWLIDHGSALIFHHDWRLMTEQAPREPVDYGAHVFADRVSLLERFDAELASLVTRDVLERAVAQVPDAFLEATSAGDSPERARATYQAFLWKRLKAPRPFVPGA